MIEKFSKRQAYANNLNALKQLLSENPTPEQLEGFHGFGALNELLLSPDDKSQWSSADLSFEKEVTELHKILENKFGPKYKEAVSSLKNSLLSSFYTPDFIIEPVVKTLAEKMEDVDTILEPSAGSGKFIKHLKKHFPDSKITAVEKDITTHAVLSAIHKDVEAIHSGFENFKNRKFDLAISNIPFGTVSVYDDQIYREAVPVKVKATTRIHNYFFVKGLDNVTDGGLVAYVTSAGVMDSPGNREIRDYLMKNSDLVSAIRLPNNVFAGAGTYPMTDIIVLRKSRNKKNLSPIEKEFVESDKITLEKDGKQHSLDINSYYLKHPEKALGIFTVGGQYGKDALDIEPALDFSTEKISKQITAIISEDSDRVLNRKFTVASLTKEENNENKLKEIPEKYPNRENLKEGNLVVLGSAVGYATYLDDKLLFKPQPVIKDVERTAALIPIRNSLNKLIDAELAGDKPSMELHRKALNESYDQFVFQYGNLYHTPNKKLLLFDMEGFKLLSLENSVGGKYEKADIFSKQVNNVEKGIEKFESLKDAILLSLNTHNRIDIEFISGVTDQPPKEVIRQGVDQDLLFLEPVSKFGAKFVPKDEFLSGNVVKKFEDLEKIKTLPDGFTDEHRQKHLQKLEEIRPTYLSRELIEINFGVRWVPMDVYEAFAQELFKAPVEIKYLNSLGQYLVNVKGSSNEDEITYAATTHNGRISGSKLMEYAFIDTYPQLSIKISDGPPPEYKPDIDGMKNAEQKIKEIKSKFEEYTTKNKDVAKRLEVKYNREINNFVKRSYDGSHLTFEGIDHYTPKHYQANGVWKLIQEEGGLMDHVVGAGKSLTMAMASMKMRQLGIARKPLILCLKANVDAVARHFQLAFPKAKILAPSETDFTKEKRKTIFASIATNDWDAVILTHDNFLKIPQNPHIVSRILNEELKNLEDDLKVVRGNSSLSKRVLKGLEKRKENTAVKLKQHEASIKRDDYVMNFDTMGFDHITVDEAQEFKNLAFTTRQQQVAGLGSPEGSAKARNLQYAVRTIQEKKGGDKGVTLATGTPISNSLVELYLLKKYLRPNKLEEAGINSFDAWALMFAKKSVNYEFTITNEIKAKERYREFINLPELGMWYSDMAHVVTKAELKEDKPKMEHIMVNIEPSETQKDYIDRLIQFTKTKEGHHVGLPPLSDSEKNAFMLLATNLAKKMSLDMRLISSSYSYEPDGKIGTLCKMLSQEYKDSTAFKGTQLIFSDMGTPTGKGFNVYAEIKRVLTTVHGIPENEIAFVHDHDTKAKKRVLERKVNAGEIRFVIGSTKKLGTGTNMQERIMAVHHLDIPWRPSDMEQRDGRADRQGAEMAKLHRNNTVRSYVYAVNRTLDAYQFNILSNKQRFITQIKGTVKDRRIDEGSMDQDGGMNFAEYVALLSGNTDLLEKVKLEKKLADVERSFQAFLKQRNDAQYSKGFLEREIKSEQGSLKKLQVDSNAIGNKDLEKAHITVNGNPIEDRKVVGEILLKKFKEINNGKQIGSSITHTLATLDSFTLKYERNIIATDRSRVFVEGPSGLIYNYAEGKLNENPALAGRFMIDALKRIPKVIEGTEDRIKKSNEKIALYDLVLKEEFPNKGEIDKLKKQISDLHDRIENAINEKNKAEEKEKAVTPATQAAKKGEIQLGR